MKNITQENSYIYSFSVATLVTNFLEYQEMVNSFRDAGFDESNSEFIYIDNSNENIEDGYSGINKFLNRAQGKYIIICHQDVLLKYDDVEVLKACLIELDNLDSEWAIAGNAGFASFTQKFYRISDPHGENTQIGKLPANVKSLDENFLVVKNEANLCLSNNLKGFHLYATDLITIAKILGWNAYVIDFHLYHKSGGKCDENFMQTKKDFIQKYSQLMKPLYIQTTCTSMIITSSCFFNMVLNQKLFYSIRKKIEKCEFYLKRYLKI